MRLPVRHESIIALLMVQMKKVTRHNYLAVGLMPAVLRSHVKVYLTRVIRHRVTSTVEKEQTLQFQVDLEVT